MAICSFLTHVQRNPPRRCFQGARVSQKASQYLCLVSPPLFSFGYTLRDLLTTRRYGKRCEVPKTYPGEDGGVAVTKRKSDYPETEVEIETSVVASSCAPAEPGSEGMEQGLFEDLVESIREAGAILRGEREAARRTRFDAPGGASSTQEQE